MSRVHFSHAGAPRGLRVLHPSLVLILFSLVPGASAWFMGGGISYVTLPSLGIPPVYVFPSLYITHKKNYPFWQHSTSVSPGQWFLPIVAHTNTSRGMDKSASDIGRQDDVSGPFPSQGRVCGAQGSQKRYVHICWCMSIDYTMKTHTINCQCQNRGIYARISQETTKSHNKKHATDDSGPEKMETNASKRKKITLSLQNVNYGVLLVSTCGRRCV